MNKSSVVFFLTFLINFPCFAGVKFQKSDFSLKGSCIDIDFTFNDFNKPKDDKLQINNNQVKNKEI